LQKLKAPPLLRNRKAEKLEIEQLRASVPSSMGLHTHNAGLCQNNTLTSIWQVRFHVPSLILFFFMYFSRSDKVLITLMHDTLQSFNQSFVMKVVNTKPDLRKLSNAKN
jgi:hypothetical protein